MNFSQYGLRPEVMQALIDAGYETPTEIQQETLPCLLANQTDLVGLARTGTGKTAAFGLPILQRINPQKRTPQAVILSPTRELCLQIATELKKFAKYLPEIRVAAVYGGVSMYKQTEELRSGVQIIVATPGRMVDHLKRENTQLVGIDILVLDEADEMLNMGFQEELNQILAQTNPQKNVWLFSATMPNEIRQIAEKYLRNPIEISVGKNEVAENVRHYACFCQHSSRYEALKRILDAEPKVYGIVFTRTKTDAQQVAEKLIQDGYPADALHGDLSQIIRDTVMRRFRERSLQILVATDVAARGIDVNDLTHVIHYALPDDLDSYIHRSGRTARAGKSGTSIAIVTNAQKNLLRQIEKLIHKPIEKKKIPTGQEIVNIRWESFLKKFRELPEHTPELDKRLPEVFQSFADFSREEIIRRFCYLELNRLLDYYRNAVDLNLPERSEKKGKADNSASKSKYQKVFINIGKMDGVSKMELLEMIAQATGLPKNHINRIELFQKHSHFECFADETNAIIEGFRGTKLDGRKIRIDFITGEEEKPKVEFSKRLSKNKEWSERKPRSIPRKTRFKS
ncbi:MAG: DEAD/DEAH box helicase [Bacteroidia bacterium]|nr:DEAD/DEAH box helicase [Bacteroidia bacterium]